MTLNEILRGNRGVLSATAGAILISGITTDARALDAKVAQAALLKTPMMKGLKLNDFKADGKHFSAGLGSKKHPAVIFNTGTDKKPIWNVALYPKSLKLGSIYKTGSAALLGGISLANPAVVMSQAKSAVKYSALPKPVQDGIKKVFGSAIKTVTYPAGNNFSFTIDVTKTPGLKDLKTALGVTSTKVPMAGTMGSDFIRYLANGKAATKKTDLAAVSLSAALKGIKPKLASKSFTAPSMIVTYQGAKDGKVGIVGGATITTVVAKKKMTFRTGMKFDLKAKNADKVMISIYGPLVKPLKKAEDFGGYKAAVLNLNSAVMGNKRLAVAFSGTTDKKKPFKATAKLDRGNIIVEQAFAANLTVKDVLGYSQQALDKVPFKNPKKVGNVVTGTVTLAGGDMEAYVFKADAKAKNPYLALIPKEFVFSSWVPAAAGSLLDGAKVDKAALLVVPSGGGGDRPLRELPKIVSDKILGVVGKKIITNNKNKLPIAAGVNLYTRVDVNKSNTMRFMFDKLKIKDKLLTFVGSVNPVVFWVLPEKAGAQLKKNKKIHKEILKTLTLTTAVTRPQIPGVEQVLEFGPGVLRIRGSAVADRIGVRTDTGDVEIVSEIINSVKVKLPGKDIGMQAQINLHKGIADKSYKLKIIGTSTFDWNKAFTIPFLTLNDISLAATFNVNKKGDHAFAAGLKSKIKLGAQEIKSGIDLVFQKRDGKKSQKGDVNKGKKVYKVEDIVLSVPGKIELSKLPGLSQIPGIKDFAFENYKLSKTATHGTLIWKTIGLKAQAAMVRINGKYSLFGRFPDLSLKKLFGRLPKPLDLIGELKMPRAVLAFSSQKLTGYELRHLPLAAQDMLKDIVKNPANEVPIWNGVTLIGALGEKDLPKPLHKIIADDLGVFKVIDGDLVLAGGLTGLFGGNPTIGLYADLPGFKFPANQPWSKIVSFERAKANFFIRGDVGATMFNLGVGGEMQVKVPHLVDPKKVDTLKFRGEGYVSADAVSAAGGVKVAGRMEGKWREPFGLKNFTFENPAILIGADSEGSVEFGIGATAEFAARNKQKLRFAGDFITNINFSSTIPLPKKLGVRLQAKKLGIMAQMEVADAMFRGVMTGPMANVVTKLIPDPAAKKAARYLQSELSKRSMIDILQIEKLPYPYFEMRDVDVYFATPGAVIPGREDTLAGMGMVLAGKMSLNLMGQRFPIGEANNRLTFADGLKIYGKLEPRSLGPIKLNKAVIDVAANVQALPYFKIKTDTALFGATEKLDIEVSKDKIGFFYDKNLGPVIKLRIDAKTVGKDLFRVRDFVVKASTQTKIDEVITKEVFPRFGIPTVVGDIIKKSTPLYIDGGTFEGSLTEFVKGGAVTLKLDHKYFGQRMKPAVITVKPIWTDPLKAFPHEEITRELRRSFLLYLATNPVNLPPVNLGLVTIENAKLTALATDPKDPKFVISGKMSNFLGASRAVDVALSDKGYAFRVKDKIAGGLWDSDFRAWTVGGTAQAPKDIRYYGTLSSDFEKWLRQEVGKNMNKGFDAINAGYTSASNRLRDAETKVRNLDNLIGSKRAEARRDLNNLRHLLARARSHLDRTKWLMDKAWGSYNYYDRRWRDERRGAFWPWEWAKVAVMWGLRSGAWVAGKAAEGIYIAARESFNAINRGLTNIPLDLHPKVAPLIVARALALGGLQTVRLAVEGAQHLNKEFKGVANALVNAVAGAKVLVVKKASFQGSIRETKTNVFMLADIMKQENVTLKLKTNLLKPWETDLRALTIVLTSMIKGERVNLARESMPAPPKLPLAIVSKADIANAVVAAVREKARIASEARRREAARKQQLAAATASSSGGISNSLLIGYQDRCLDFSVSERNARGARRATLRDCTGNANQRFTMVANGELRADGLCLDNQEGGWLWGYKCTGHVGMRYRQLADGRLQNIRSGECVDLPGGQGGNGKPLRFGACSDAAHQKWEAAANPKTRDAGVFNRAQLVNGRGRCADETSGRMTRGGQMIMWTCNSSGASKERQLWTHNSRGQVLATNGLCLDVRNPNVARGMELILWTCNGSGAPMQRQRWRMLRDGRVQHIQSGFCIDATNSGNQRGRLNLQVCATTPSQTFRPRS